MRDSGKPKYLDGKRDLTSTQEAGFWKTNLGAGWGIFFACQCQEFRKSLFVHLSFFRFFPSASSYWGGKALIQTDIQNINRKGQSTSYTVISFCSTGLFSAGSKPWDKEGPGLPKKMFRPFGPQFGPKIRWEGGEGAAPPVPSPLPNPPLFFKLEYFGNKKRDSGNRWKKCGMNYFFAEKDLVFPDAEHRPLCTQRRSVCNMDHPIDRRTLTKKRLLKY